MAPCILLANEGGLLLCEIGLPSVYKCLPLCIQTPPVSCKSPRNLEKYNLVIIRDIETDALRGETKLMPPRKDKNGNYLNIKKI